jgi:hypothetical protein
MSETGVHDATARSPPDRAYQRWQCLPARYRPPFRLCWLFALAEKDRRLFFHAVTQAASAASALLKESADALLVPHAGVDASLQGSASWPPVLPAMAGPGSLSLPCRCLFDRSCLAEQNPSR